jgi:hypothetical protein
MCLKIKGMERRHGNERTESQHEENQAYGVRTYSATPAPSLVLSVGVELEIIPSSVHNTDCGYIRNVAMSVENLSSIQTTICCDKARPIDGRPDREVDLDGTLYFEATFSYLGDMLCAGG